MKDDLGLAASLKLLNELRGSVCPLCARAADELASLRARVRRQQTMLRAQAERIQELENVGQPA